MGRYLKWVNNRFFEVMDDFLGCRYEIGEVCCKADSVYCADFVGDEYCASCPKFAVEDKVQIRHILLNLILHISQEQHELDHTFISVSMEETQERMERKGYVPEGICIDVPYGTDSVGFVYRDSSLERRWVHLPHSIIVCWLKDCEMLHKGINNWNDVVDAVWLSAGPTI